MDYAGTDETCSICTEHFSDGSTVIRLRCRHCFHSTCYADDVAQRVSTVNVPLCPNFRGSGQIVSRFRYIAIPPPAQPPSSIGSFQHVSEHAAASSPARSDSGRPSSVDSIPTGERIHGFPVWVIATIANGDGRPDGGRHAEGDGRQDDALSANAGTVLSHCFHSGTSLPGRISCLVDPGARVSMAGYKLIRQLSKMANDQGHKPKQEKLHQPLAFQGVGAGQPTARWKVTVPSAVQTTDGTQLMEFGAPAVEGAEGEDLPLLYGLDGMEKKKAVLKMHPEGPTLTFPGPSGYTISWGPGATHIPLAKAPSGHLAFALDHYQQLPQGVHQRSSSAPPLILQAAAASSQAVAAPRATVARESPLP